MYQNQSKLTITNKENSDTFWHCHAYKDFSNLKHIMIFFIQMYNSKKFHHHETQKVQMTFWLYCYMNERHYISLIQSNMLAETCIRIK